MEPERDYQPLPVLTSGQHAFWTLRPGDLFSPLRLDENVAYPELFSEY